MKRKLLFVTLSILLLFSFLSLSSCGDKEAETKKSFNFKAVKAEYQQDIGTHKLRGYINGISEIKTGPEYCEHTIGSGYSVNKDTHTLCCRRCQMPLEEAQPHSVTKYNRVKNIGSLKIYLKVCDICSFAPKSTATGTYYSEIILTAKKDKVFKEEYIKIVDNQQ